MAHGSSRPSDQPESSQFDSSLAALRSSPAFRGPVVPGDVHDASGHLALIYQTSEEKFDTVAPFISQGLDRGEQCLYITEENEREDVLSALRSRGVDVDEAVDAGALSLPSVADIYFQNGIFDPDRSISVLGATITESRTGYTGFRVTGEIPWKDGSGPEVSDLLDYEQQVNSLLGESNCLALCQYHTETFPPSVIRQVIETHPHIVSESTITRNVYYTPPEADGDVAGRADDVDALLAEMRERTAAQVALAEQKELLQGLYEISSNRDRPFEEKVEAMLDLGCEFFDLQCGALTHLRSQDSDFELTAMVGPVAEEFSDGLPTQPEPDCFCRQAITQETPVGTTDITEIGWEHDALYEKYGLTAYIGVRVGVRSSPYGTLWFGDMTPREDPFTDAEYRILELMGQWISYEIERQQRSRYLREQHEIVASPTRSFDEKLQALLDMGCERFDLELGAVARVDPAVDRFEIEYTNDDHDYFEPGTQLPLSETFCIATAETDDTQRASGPTDERHEDISVYRKFGLRTYLGTYVPVDGGTDRTFFFVSSDIRDEPFPKEEHTFLRLMGQWLKYELERKHRAERLQSKKESLSRLNRINALVQDLVQAFVEEPSRTGIEQTVCDRLAASEFYQAAWIGERSLSSAGLTPRVWAGVSEESLTRCAAPAGEGSPDESLGELAIESREVRQRRADETATETVPEQRLPDDVGSALAVPIWYEDTSYGVLTVYTSDPETFDEPQQRLFGEFGKTLGFAITALERKQALVAEEAIELELRLRAPAIFFFDVTADTAATFTLEGIVPTESGPYIMYVTLTGASADSIVDLASPEQCIEHARIVDEQGESAVLEFTIGGPSIVDAFAKYGATVTDATVSDGTGRFTVELPQTADVRSVVEAVEETVSEVTVIAKRSVDRPVQTASGFESAVTEALTDKQSKVLRAAFRAGYFDRPRTSTGDELAETFDISSSTFHQHCRVALRKLLETVFDSSYPRTHRCDE